MCHCSPPLFFFGGGLHYSSQNLCWLRFMGVVGQTHLFLTIYGKGFSLNSKIFLPLEQRPTDWAIEPSEKWDETRLVEDIRAGDNVVGHHHTISVRDIREPYIQWCLARWLPHGTINLQDDWFLRLLWCFARRCFLWTIFARQWFSHWNPLSRFQCIPMRNRISQDDVFARPIFAEWINIVL